MATFEDGKNSLTNRDYAYQYYLNKGLTPIMASAIIGNLVKESGLNTGIVGRADNKGSVGIAQWHSERLDNLKKFAGKNWKGLDNQLDFVLHELNTTEPTAYNKLKQAKTVEEATTAFMNHYERPSSNPKINRINDRINEALEVSGSPRSNYTSPNYSFDSSINMEAKPSSLETSTTEYKEPEDPETVEAKQDIAKKSFQEDLNKLMEVQQEAVTQKSQEVQQDFIPNDLPDPYNYIQQDPGYNFEEFQNGGKVAKEELEDVVNRYLGYPQTKARKASEIFGEDNPVDAIRHAEAGRYTTEALNKRGLGVMNSAIASNAMGVAHEAMGLIDDRRPWADKLRESGEDIFNNAVGSAIGVLPLNSDKKTDLIKKLAIGNLLPDGVVIGKEGEVGGGTDEYFKDKTGNIHRKYQQGGNIIEDDRGQWAHPGEITKINSSNITMRGVGYPVLGVDNLGNQKMMYPNQDYKFEGDYVIEYPQNNKLKNRFK